MNASTERSVPAGFWRLSASSALLPCSYPQACSGGNSSGVALCADGYAGVLCATASEKGEYIDWTSRDLESCSVETVVLAVLLSSLTFALLAYISCCAISQTLPSVKAWNLQSSSSSSKKNKKGQDAITTTCAVLWQRCWHRPTPCNLSEVSDEASIEEDDHNEDTRRFCDEEDPFGPAPPPPESSLERCSNRLRSFFRLASASSTKTASTLLPKRAIRKMHYYQTQEQQLRQQMQLCENEHHEVYIWISRLKTVIFYLQICSTLPNILALSFPQHSSSLMRIMSFVGLASLQSLPWTCFAEVVGSSEMALNFLLLMELSTLIPALLLMLLSVLAMLYYELLYFFFDTDDLHSNSSNDNHALEPARRRQEIHLQRQWSHELLIQRYVTSLALLFYVSLGGIANSLLQSFTCIDIENDAKEQFSVLWVDVNVSCQSSLYFYSKVWAIIAALVFLGFLPAMHLLILTSFRHSIKDHYHAWSALLLQGFSIQELWTRVHEYKETVLQKSAGALKTLFWGYRESCSAWELLELVYRVAILAFVPLYHSRSVIKSSTGGGGDSTEDAVMQSGHRLTEINQLLLALFFSTLYLLGLVYWKPFYLASQQSLAECAAVHILVLILCAMALKLELLSTDNSEFDLVIMAVLLATPMYAALQTLLFRMDPLLNAKQTCPATILLLPEGRTSSKTLHSNSQILLDISSEEGEDDYEEDDDEVHMEERLLNKRSLQAFPSFYEYMYYMQDYESHYQRLQHLQQQHQQQQDIPVKHRVPSRRHDGRTRSKRDQAILAGEVVSSESDSTGTTFDQVLLHKYELKQLQKQIQSKDDDRSGMFKNFNKDQASDKREPSFTRLPISSAKLRSRCRLSYGASATDKAKSTKTKNSTTTNTITATEDWNSPSKNSRSLFDHYPHDLDHQERKDVEEFDKQQHSPPNSRQRAFRESPECYSTPKASRKAQTRTSELMRRGKGTKDTQEVTSHSDSRGEDEGHQEEEPAALRFPHLPIHSKHSVNSPHRRHQSVIASDGSPPSPSSIPPHSPRPHSQRVYSDTSPAFDFPHVYQQPSSISSHELRPATPLSAVTRLPGSRSCTPASMAKRTPRNKATRTSTRTSSYTTDDPPSPALLPAMELQPAVRSYSSREERRRSPADLSKVLQLVKRFEGDSV